MTAKQDIGVVPGIYVLDAYLFDSLSEVREISERWLEEYNAIRPHEAFQILTPYQYHFRNT